MRRSVAPYGSVGAGVDRSRHAGEDAEAGSLVGGVDKKRQRRRLVLCGRPCRIALLPPSGGRFIGGSIVISDDGETESADDDADADAAADAAGPSKKSTAAAVAILTTALACTCFYRAVSSSHVTTASATFRASVALDNVAFPPPKDGSAASADRTPKVFIGIKTGEGPSGLRFGQVRRTWLRDALVGVEEGTVDVKFFVTDELYHSIVGGGHVAAKKGVGDVPQETDVGENGGEDDGDTAGRVGRRSMDKGGRGGGSADDAGAGSGAGASPSSPPLPPLPRSIFVPTHCSLKKDLLCATSAMYRHYLELYSAADDGDDGDGGPFFCSFDDDQYLLVTNLLRALDEYRSHPGTNLYIGRQVIKGGTIVPQVRGGKVRHLTGGAGYCLSRDVVERGRDLFTDLTRVWRKMAGRTIGYTDDVAVGYVADRILNATLVDDNRFHSHYETNLRQSMPLDDVRHQISFGYDTKRKFSDKEKRRNLVNESMPNVPLGSFFASDGDDDPMLFRALHCFLAMAEEEGEEERVPGYDLSECGVGSEKVK